MLLQGPSGTWKIEPPTAATFGRSQTNDLLIGHQPADRAVSRAAGRIVWSSDRWVVENLGSRSFFVVEPGGENELIAGVGATHPLTANHSWIRVPGADGDHAILCTVADDELPAPERHQTNTVGDVTLAEGTVSLTPNELRSVVAVYEGYLLLPPAYDPQPRSWRAASRRLRVEEGKVRADHRRVAQKVAAAGGPDGGGSRYRDALIGWMLSRGVVTPDDRDLVV